MRLGDHSGCEAQLKCVCLLQRKHRDLMLEYLTGAQMCRFRRVGKMAESDY
jgi:hypothetical protein